MPYLIDCRWFGTGGAGRVTELLLRAWHDAPPDGDWLLWGPRSISQYQWDRSELCEYPDAQVPNYRDRLPRHSAALFLHQLHRLTRFPSITLFYDTIPVRYGGSLATRVLKLGYFMLVAHTAEGVVTVSDYSKQCIERDLRLASNKISVASIPVDGDWAARLRQLRSDTVDEPIALYVGRLASHKNVRRLITAFARSRFRANGGILQLVGATSSEIIELRSWMRDLAVEEGVKVLPICSQSDLDLLYAKARLLVCPSLEEGYGLPVYEALAIGLPVATSQGGALAAIAGAADASFDPLSVSSIAAALDRVGLSCRVLRNSVETPDIGQFGRMMSQMCAETFSREG